MIVKLLTTDGLFTLAAVAHELGHVASARALGCRSRLGLRLRPFPHPVARMILPDESLGLRRALIALGGPAASVLVGCVILRLGFVMAGGGSVIVGLLSLVPVKPQDGWNVREALRDGSARRLRV